MYEVLGKCHVQLLTLIVACLLFCPNGLLFIQFHWPLSTYQNMLYEPTLVLDKLATRLKLPAIYVLGEGAMMFNVGVEVVSLLVLLLFCNM